jgi:GNAT superfamily N-acetyltransferase
MSITYRHGTPADSCTVAGVTAQNIASLTFERYQALYDHLARTAEHFWVAERAGQVIGYARSTLRDGLRELTEFHVAPGNQSAGVGRELLMRVFPATRARRRVILASQDVRAQARYLKSGIYPRFSWNDFSRTPEPVSAATDLTIEPVSAMRGTLAACAVIDKELFDFSRDADHEFLLGDRQGYLYYRGSQVVGYGYLGTDNGPFALLDARDFPAVLAHAETDAARRGVERFAVIVPLINRAAVSYLLARRFLLAEWFGFFMSDEPFGTFENYIQCSPGFFL